MVELTQKSFNSLVEILNHRMTHIEHDVTWMKKILGWQITLVSGIFISVLGVVIKFIFFA